MWQALCTEQWLCAMTMNQNAVCSSDHRMQVDGCEFITEGAAGIVHIMGILFKMITGQLFYVNVYFKKQKLGVTIQFITI